MKNIFSLIILIFLGCQPEQQSMTSRNAQSNLALSPVEEALVEKREETGALGSDIEVTDEGVLLRADGRSKKVSSLDLEDARFAIEYLTPSLQEYLDSETVILTFDRPIDSDYVEILRCQSDVIVNTGIVMIDFKDFGLNGMTEEEKLSLYSAGDVFTMAMGEQGCTYLNEASLEESIPDAWAPSGSYRYMATACVAPNRLIDSHLYSKRNCSRRFALSPLIHYTNQRKEDEKEALHDLETVRSGLDILATTLGEQAFSLIEAMDSCERREHQRGVDVEQRNNVLRLVGAAMEISLELVDFCKTRNLFKKVGKGISKAGAKGAIKGAAGDVGSKLDDAAKKIDTGDVGKKASSKADDESPGFIQTVVDSTQLGQAMEGMTFTMILTNLFSTAADMPRSCETVLSMNESLEITLEQMYVLAQQYVYFETVLAQVRQGISNNAGLETEDVDVEVLNPGATEEEDSSGGSGGLYND